MKENVNGNVKLVFLEANVGIPVQTTVAKEILGRVSARVKLVNVHLAVSVDTTDLIATEPVVVAVITTHVNSMMVHATTAHTLGTMVHSALNAVMRDA